MEQALERRPGLALRLFTDGERAYAARRARPGQHLAARFCAKEAVAKALRLEAWNPRDIEVVGEGAQTAMALHGALAALGVQVDVSMTHSKATAGAVALVRGRRAPCRTGCNRCRAPSRCAPPIAGRSRSEGSRRLTSWSAP